MTKAQILEGARALTPADRIDLVMELWDTLAPDADQLPVSPALREELRRRMADDSANSEPAEDWNTLRTKLLRGDI